MKFIMKSIMKFIMKSIMKSDDTMVLQVKGPL